MINILIVEDSVYKLSTIKKLLIDDLMIEEACIHSAEDIKTAKKLLIGNMYDLLILDLVLPLEKGDEPHPDKGIGFLADLESNPNIMTPIHIIGMTEFIELQEKYRIAFENHLWYLINYSAMEINWQNKLKKVTYHLLTTKQRFLESVTNQQTFDIAVVTALHKPEFEKILEWPVQWERFNISNDPTIYYKTSIEKEGKIIKILSACVEQMGMTATAVISTKIIHTFKPKLIIMGGICAGLQEKGFNFGDILIADQSWDYGSGKIKEINSNDSHTKDIIFEPDPRPIQIAPALKSKINTFLQKKDIISKIHNDCRYIKPPYQLKAELGPIACGSYVISSSSKVGEIKAVQRKLAGVEMEGYGLFFSCDHNQDLAVKGLIIKSVSDYGDSTKNDQYQDYSSYTSAMFIYHFIIEELFNHY